MGAGAYDSRVNIQTDSLTEDAFGGDVQGWTDVSKVWAEIEYGSAGERRVGVAQEQSSLLASVTVRRSTTTLAIKPSTYRLQFDDMNWDIEGIAPGKKRNKSLVIIAKARL